MPNKDEPRSRPQDDVGTDPGATGKGQAPRPMYLVPVSDGDIDDTDERGTAEPPSDATGDTQDTEPTPEELSRRYLEQWRNDNPQRLLPEGLEDFKPTEDLPSLYSYTVGESVDHLPDPREFSHYRPSVRGRRRL